ncbi:SDR family NAD(P)-dependent oxidoreductase [Nocardia sp. NPDC059246]|uniref:SDR family NAD(P)-dependent oxidoreductase n=1 Tax=unclassified Nocardia TaxID=2637762 RepID=UPI00368BBA7B
MDGQVVVVTGGSRGMGKEMVTAFAQRGAHVVIASRKVENCEVLAEKIASEYGVRALPVRCNVSSWSDCDELVDKVYDEFGRVDVLVNNAGLSPLYPSLDQVSEAMFDKVIGINLKGPFRLAVAIGTRMAAAGGGSIINISSVAAIRPDPHSLPYAAAKAGLNALTEGLAQALGPSVRVNGIQCGAFLTDVSTAWTPEIREQLGDAVALGRCGEPEEVLGAVLYFATSASSFSTGAILRLDGGMR